MHSLSYLMGCRKLQGYELTDHTDENDVATNLSVEASSAGIPADGKDFKATGRTVPRIKSLLKQAWVQLRDHLFGR